MSKEERHRIYEYAMDRKNREIKALEDVIKELRTDNELYKIDVIVAEIILFLFGMLVGAYLMKIFGGTQ
ncbi:hypothetical protein EBZ39_13445 [bacterium]|nr:hypothetical protein [bacterium]